MLTTLLKIQYVVLGNGQTAHDGRLRSSDPQKFLQLHHREHPDWLQHHLVWQLLGLQPEDTTEGSVYGPVHHWGQASCHPVPLYQAVSEEGPKITKDSSHPSHRLFSLLPHCMLYRSANSMSKKASLQIQPPSHKTAEQIIKWPPWLLTFPRPPPFVFTLLLLAIYYQCRVTLALPTCTK